jgi:hypothetical protein
MHPLKFFTLLPGFACIFDDTRDAHGYSTFFEQFFDGFPHRYVDSTNKIKPVSARSRGLVRHYLTKSDEKKRVVKSIEVFDAHPSGDGYEGHGLPLFGLINFFRGTEPDNGLMSKWSCQRMYLPANSEAMSLLAWTLKAARAFPIRFGVGGLTLAPAFPNYEGDPAEAYRFCKRHPGVIFWTYETKKAKHGIRDTNWLTLVTNSILKKAGGIEAARKKLSSEIVLHEVREGWLFQAGPEPLLGDCKEPTVDFRLYSEVAKFLKPCRDKTALWGPYQKPGEFTHEEMLGWIARFDAGNLYTY